MTGMTAEKHVVTSGTTVRRMTVTAFFAAMITLMTAYIFHIPVGINGGYVHLGDALIYLGAAMLPMPYACVAAAIGGGLADLLTAPIWAPATIIIKILICLPFSCKSAKIVSRRNVIALAAACIISSLGYFLAEGILFGFHTAFLLSVSGSLVQACGSTVVFVMIGSALDRAGFKNRFTNKL